MDPQEVMDNMGAFYPNDYYRGLQGMSSGRADREYRKSQDRARAYSHRNYAESTSQPPRRNSRHHEQTIRELRDSLDEKKLAQSYRGSQRAARHRETAQNFRNSQESLSPDDKRGQLR